MHDLLKSFRDDLAVKTFGKGTKENMVKGLCIQCKEPALANCYSEAGVREVRISGLCEKCFDKICGGEE